jgi:uncharacterized membrane protein YhaH (DUF805 family)
MKKNTSTFTGSIKMCLKKYAIIKGRASRSEYWWFQALFVPLAFFVVIMSETEDFESLSLLLTLSYLVCFAIFILTIIPCIAVTINQHSHYFDKPLLTSTNFYFIFLFRKTI